MPRCRCGFHVTETNNNPQRGYFTECPMCGRRGPYMNTPNAAEDEFEKEYYDYDGPLSAIEEERDNLNDEVDSLKAEIARLKALKESQTVKHK